MFIGRPRQNRGEAGMKNDVPGNICIPVTTPARAQPRWGCGSSRLLHFFLLLRIEAIVSVITCSDSGNSFLLLKHQRPQQPVCLLCPAMGITARGTLRTKHTCSGWVAVSTAAFYALCSLVLVVMLKGRLTPKPRALSSACHWFL